MEKMVQIPDNFINENTDFRELIAALKTGFASEEILVPMRHHHDFPNPKVGADSTLLLMPAWHSGKMAGVKIATVSPKNGQFGLPSIQAVYVLMDALKGTMKAILQAKSLTAKRTAAASALASSFLSREDSSSLLMIGTGALSTNLIRAHASVRPIKNVYVWGRNFEKAQAVCDSLKREAFKCQAVKTISEKIGEVDIISAATLSKTPLVLGKYLKAGQHVDLVGAYRKDMREADDATVSKASVYIDTFQGGLKESGDIAIPLKSGVLKEENIKGDLFGLCTDTVKGRSHPEEITYFKSVGHALEDLMAASYYYELFING
ncbi:ornithine cyclodeaminase [Pricia antarctica]|uniref:Ornithine cyclodeaminase n=1 Tax=Pricia antarctica TaxID=641691 RepID=A0A1G6WRW0_9FLAO|nr:ornithine cyclodeaminase family protein [Pricia antarctica]SDD68622.1 ornithine cyclodeaminase [Pricia antarctica]